MVNKSEIKCIEMFKSILKTDKVEMQKKFDFILGDVTKTGRRMKLPVDAYFPEHNFVLEYMGRQHRDDVSHMNRRAGRREQRKKYDKIKAEMLKLHNIKLIYFWYDEEITEENVRKKLVEAGILKE